MQTRRDSHASRSEIALGPCPRQSQLFALSSSENSSHDDTRLILALELSGQHDEELARRLQRRDPDAMGISTIASAAWRIR